MQQITAVEIERKQDHMRILQKVRNNKPVTAGERRRLKKHELDMAKKKSKTNPAKNIKLPPVKAKKTAKKVKRSKSKKARQTRPPVSAAVVKQAAVTCETTAEAEFNLKVKEPLTDLFEKYPKLKQAWDRGRLIRALSELASTAITIAEAEESLELEKGTLAKLLETDAEIADTWNQARLQIIIEVKRSLVEAAKTGKPSAAKHIEAILRQEVATHNRTDFSRVSIEQLVEVTGKTRQTIHSWYTKYALARNSDKTFNLAVVFPWFEQFAAAKLSRSAKKITATDPLKAAKAEKLEIDLARQRRQLLPRDEVIAGQLARHQNLVNATNRKPEDLAMLCHGQPPEKIAEILRQAFADILRAQCQVPEELYLTEKAGKMFVKLLKTLEPEGGSDISDQKTETRK